jgi:hypothetical protein
MVFENSEISAFCVAPDHHQPESLTVFNSTGKSTHRHRPTSKSQHQHQHSKEEGHSTGEQGGDARGKEDEPKSMWGRLGENRRQATNCEGLRSKKETLEEEMKRIEDDMEIEKCRREGVEEGGVLGVLELRRERIGKFL